MTAGKFNTVLKALKIDLMASILLPHALFKEVVLNNCIAFQLNVFTWIWLDTLSLMARGHCWDSDECIKTSEHSVNAKWPFHHRTSRS